MPRSSETLTSPLRSPAPRSTLRPPGRTMAARIAWPHFRQLLVAHRSYCSPRLLPLARPTMASPCPSRLSSTGSSLATGDASLARSGGFVGGRWLQAAATFPVRDPATGMELLQVADCGVTEAEAAVKAAYEAGAAWSAASAKVSEGKAAGGVQTSERLRRGR